MTQSYDFLLCDNTCYNLFIIRDGSGALRLCDISHDLHSTSEAFSNAQVARLALLLMVRRTTRHNRA